MPNTTDAAEEAKKYGKLFAANEELTTKNKALVKENAELEAAVAKNTELVRREERALETLSEEANARRSAVRDKEEQISEDLIEREKKMTADEKDLVKREKELAKQIEGIALREDNVTAKEAGVSTDKADIIEVRKTLKQQEDRQDAKEKELKEAAVTLKKAIDENKAVLKEQNKILEDTVEERKKADNTLSSTKLEVAKLQDLTGKMRSENEVNGKIKKQMEDTIPKLQNLVLVLREFQDFIVAHSKNPDAIQHKFEEIAKRLDISIEDSPKK